MLPLKAMALSPLAHEVGEGPGERVDGLALGHCLLTWPHLSLNAAGTRPGGRGPFLLHDKKGPKEACPVRFILIGNTRVQGHG